jgi:hypothetical protein
MQASVEVHSSLSAHAEGNCFHRTLLPERIYSQPQFPQLTNKILALENRPTLLPQGYWESGVRGCGNSTLSNVWHQGIDNYILFF